MYAERLRDDDACEYNDDVIDKTQLNVWVVPLSALQNVLVLDTTTPATITETDNGKSTGGSDSSGGKKFKLKPSVVIHARNFEKKTWIKCRVVDVITSKRAIDDIVNAIAGQNIVDVSFEGVVPLRLSEVKGFLKQREVRRVVEKAASFVVLKEVIENRDSGVYDADTHEQKKTLDGNVNSRRSNYGRTKGSGSHAARRNVEGGKINKVSVHAGMKIATLGSPFGVLSPNIFSRLLNRGCVSSALVAIANQDTSSNVDRVIPPAVSVVDLSIALKPGAEGSPVFLDESTGRAKGQPIVVGVLIPPLSFANSEMEVRAVVRFHLWYTLHGYLGMTVLKLTICQYLPTKTYRRLEMRQSPFVELRFWTVHTLVAVYSFLKPVMMTTLPKV